MNDLSIWRVSCQISYPAAAKIFDKRGEIASYWQWQLDGKLSEWAISQNRITLHDISKTVILTTGYKNIEVLIDKPRNFKFFSTLATDYISFSLNLLEVKKIDMISFRLVYLAERKNFRSLVHNIRKNTYKLSRANWEPLGGYPEDVALNLSLKLDGNRVNFQLGPMEQEEMAGLFDSKETKEKLPKVALYVSYEIKKDSPSFALAKIEGFIGSFLEDSEASIRKSAYGFVEQFGGFES